MDHSVQRCLLKVMDAKKEEKTRVILMWKEIIEKKKSKMSLTFWSYLPSSVFAFSSCIYFLFEMAYNNNIHSKKPQEGRLKKTYAYKKLLNCSVYPDKKEHPQNFE